MASDNHLFGSCACERNQYTILVPAASTSLAQVFFDDSAANRRSQATPLTAWLRVPLSWYHSRTFALFPDETHSSIRRTFHTPSDRRLEVAQSEVVATTRRQFCGYCGTHLSAWDEGQTKTERQRSSEGGKGDGEEDREEWMDVTLGSLLDESLRALEGLGVLASSSSSSSEDEDDDDEGNENDPTASKDGAEVAEPGKNLNDTIMSDTAPVIPAKRNSIRNRGIPLLESLIPNTSRLGRNTIKRQKGAQTSRDGRTTVEWEVVEIDGDGGDEGDREEQDMQSGSNKRPRRES